MDKVDSKAFAVFRAVFMVVGLFWLSFSGGCFFVLCVVCLYCLFDWLI